MARIARPEKFAKLTSRTRLIADASGVPSRVTLFTGCYREFIRGHSQMDKQSTLRAFQAIPGVGQGSGKGTLEILAANWAT